MSGSMRLKIFVPTGLFLDEEVTRLVAEAPDGSFGMRPHHIDYVTTLVPGLFSYTPAGGTGTTAGDGADGGPMAAPREAPPGEAPPEEFLAVDGGVLVKCGSEVTVSTRDAVRGPDLGALRRRVEEQFRQLDERERQARSALAKMESEFVRQALRVGEHG